MLLKRPQNFRSLHALTVSAMVKGNHEISRISLSQHTAFMLLRKQGHFLSSPSQFPYIGTESYEMRKY